MLTPSERSMISALAHVAFMCHGQAGAILESSVEPMSAVWEAERSFMKIHDDLLQLLRRHEVTVVPFRKPDVGQ